MAVFSYPASVFGGCARAGVQEGDVVLAPGPGPGRQALPVRLVAASKALFRSSVAFLLVKFLYIPTYNFLASWIRICYSLHRSGSVPFYQLDPFKF